MSAPVLEYFGTSAGGRTLDEGDGGGNPFASALVELLGPHALDLDVLADDLVDLTERKSGGLQRVEVRGGAPRSQPTRARTVPPGSRVALVVVYAEYQGSGGAPSLPGAMADAARVTSGLERAGFWTRTSVDPSSAEIQSLLTEFAALSAVVDSALLYTTGHGVQVGDDIYLLPGDYPLSEGTSGLSERAISIAELTRHMRARVANLFFYAGCRDNPFA